MPRRATPVSPLSIVLSILICIGLIILYMWLVHPPDYSHDWAGHPIAPTTSAATEPPPASRPTAEVPLTSQSPASKTSVQMLLGNPSDATTDAENRDNYLMVKPYFALAYNNSAGEPKWVSWRVCSSDLGDAPRAKTFATDLSLPNGFLHVQNHMYARTGFDRGHMCPHSDRALNIETSYATFIMTNIVPQAPNNNRKCWAQLEDYCRELAKSGDRLYITSGPAGRGGIGSMGPADTVADGRVVVPAETWKVIVVVPDGGRDDLLLVNASDRVIAVDVPNDDTKCGEEWAGFRCAPSTIEAKTGLHFFGALPANVRATFDAEVDHGSIMPPRPLVHTGD